MKELVAICEAYKRVDFSKKKAALATVVQVMGSSYRSPGARMLITNDGHWTGSISGGCLEGDALRKARQVMETNTPITVRYDTSKEDNQVFAINLGCNGVIDVLLEPVDPQDLNNPIVLYQSLLDIPNSQAIGIVFYGKSEMIGKKVRLNSTSDQVENSGSVRPSECICHSDFAEDDTEEKLAGLIAADLLELFQTKKSRAIRYQFDGLEAEVFVELIQPPIQLMIFGGGFDARPLSEMAKKLGWSVTVTDECVAHIAPLFFPHADKLSLCHREFVDREFVISANTACVLISHNYEYDRDVLKKLLGTGATYIGILGPKKRFDKMLNELADHQIHLSEQDWHRIHAPIGIDIGAETPDEIAIAIIAEIMGKFTNREAGYLKYRNEPIHRRDPASNQVLKDAI